MRYDLCDRCVAHPWSGAFSTVKVYCARFVWCALTWTGPRLSGFGLFKSGFADPGGLCAHSTQLVHQAVKIGVMRWVLLQGHASHSETSHSYHWESRGFRPLGMQWQHLALRIVCPKHLKVDAFLGMEDSNDRKWRIFIKRSSRRCTAASSWDRTAPHPAAVVKTQRMMVIRGCCHDHTAAGGKLCPMFLPFNLNVFYEQIKTNVHPCATSRGQQMTTQSSCSSSSSSSSFLPMWQCVFYI